MEDELCVCSNQPSIQIKTGIDIVCIKDIQDLTALPTEAWLTEREWKDTLAVSNDTRQLQRLAGKFACKASRYRSSAR
jgi:holo-[acyl-carrier protein] synthase